MQIVICEIIFLKKVSNDLFYIFSHCKQFAPVYEEIAKELEAKNPENPIRVAKIDATEPDLQPIAQVILKKHFQKFKIIKFIQFDVMYIFQRYGVSGYPTLKIVRDGEVMDWNGGRDKAGFRISSDLIQYY